MINPLKHKYLLLLAVACGGPKAGQNPAPAPPPTAPLPTAGLAGQTVTVFPLTVVAAEDSLGWNTLLADRRATLDRADSVIGELLAARAPEVSWVLPPDLRRAARRAPGIATAPDQMGTAFLRAEGIVDVPDPLRYQMRTLVGLTGARYALVPAALVYRSGGQAVGRSGADSLTAGPPARPLATAELSLVLIDTRIGRIGWRTVARGDGDDPWTALTRSVKNLTPGLP